jgi:hypothetical protein
MDLHDNASYEASVLQLNTPFTTPQFETGEHANEDSVYCKFLMVENPL